MLAELSTAKAWWGAGGQGRGWWGRRGSGDAPAAGAASAGHRGCHGGRGSAQPPPPPSPPAGVPPRGHSGEWVPCLSSLGSVEKAGPQVNIPRGCNAMWFFYDIIANILMYWQLWLWCRLLRVRINLGFRRLYKGQRNKKPCHWLDLTIHRAEDILAATAAGVRAGPSRQRRTPASGHNARLARGRGTFASGDSQRRRRRSLAPWGHPSRPSSSCRRRPRPVDASSCR